MKRREPNVIYDLEYKVGWRNERYLTAIVPGDWKRIKVNIDDYYPVPDVTYNNKPVWYKRTNE